MFSLSNLRALIDQVKIEFARIWQSNFARQAAWLLVFNVISKGVGFLGNAYAARSLGPINLGISALVLATVQQVMLIYDGGFSIVGVRKIAMDKENSRSVIETINTFQLSMALMVSVFWLIIILFMIKYITHIKE